MGLALIGIFVAQSLFPLVSFPPARVASLLVTAVPGDFATLMIERLGHAALRALGVGVNLGTVLLGGYLGLWIATVAEEWRRARRALISAVVLFMVAMLLNLGTVGATALTPAIFYVLAAYLFARVAAQVPLLAAVGAAGSPDEEAKASGSTSRRSFLARLGWVTALAAAAGLFARPFLRSNRAADIVPADKPWKPPSDDPNFPTVAGLAPEITSNEDFYNVDINVVKPMVDGERWRLTVRGLVDTPFELSYMGLQKEFEVVEMAHTLTCISNEVGGDLISTAVWRGVRLRDVLEKGGLKGGVVDIVFRAAEGYSDSIPLAKALEPTTLLVFGMNGVALPKEHGFPVRVIVPGIYGMKNVKWVTEIEAVGTDYQGYWMVRGWSDVARVKTSSRIDAPQHGAVVREGSTIAGVAWAGDRGVERVEISTDRGATWQPAQLKRELSPLAWRLWAVSLPPGSKGRRIMVRAIDKTGSVQTYHSSRPHPDGASGYHVIDVEVV
jgi:DMSO/TMAO reductase YedYZ molybdopterin-dependent catalytic subunit